VHEIKAPDSRELDITNEKAISEYIIDFKPEVLINCAGYIFPNTIADSSTDDFIMHFAINVFGAFLCSKWSIKQNNKVIIINVGSTSAFEGRENWGAYCASKAALMSLTETLAREGIACYSLNPARTNTKMRERLFPTEDKAALMTPEHLATFVSRILNSDFISGSHLIVKKDYFYVLPMRECPK
jgi:NAD(P)-dependent dehydrogenase (short-subunit alcohol dehydrogenase family)